MSDATTEAIARVREAVEHNGDTSWWGYGDECGFPANALRLVLAAAERGERLRLATEWRYSNAVQFEDFNSIQTRDGTWIKKDSEESCADFLLRAHTEATTPDAGKAGE